MFVHGFGEHNNSFNEQFTLRSHLYDYMTRLRLFHNNNMFVASAILCVGINNIVLIIKKNNNIVPTLPVAAKGELILDELAI